MYACSQGITNKFLDCSLLLNFLTTVYTNSVLTALKYCHKVIICTNIICLLHEVSGYIRGMVNMQLPFKVMKSLPNDKSLKLLWQKAYHELEII